MDTLTTNNLLNIRIIRVLKNRIIRIIPDKKKLIYKGVGVFSVIWPSTFLFLRGRKVWYGWVPHVDDITHKIEQNVGTHKNGKYYTEKIEDFLPLYQRSKWRSKIW